MKTGNFPGRVKVRREGALARLQGPARALKAEESAESYAAYVAKREEEVKTLRGRIH